MDTDQTSDRRLELQLQLAKLELEKARLAEERREREERIERERQREREEKEAAHQRAMQLQYAAMQTAIASNVAQTAMTSNTAMGTHLGGMAIPTLAVMPTERYCGPISWLIGIFFMFPCIAACPVDERPVQVVPAPSMVYPSYQVPPSQMFPGNSPTTIPYASATVGPFPTPTGMPMNCNPSAPIVGGQWEPQK